MGPLLVELWVLSLPPPPEAREFDYSLHAGNGWTSGYVKPWDSAQGGRAQFEVLQGARASGLGVPGPNGDWELVSSQALVLSGGPGRPQKDQDQSGGVW